MKLVINKCHGGFGLSHEAMLRYFEIKGITVYPEQSNDYWKHWNYWTVKLENRIETKEGESFTSMSMDERIAYNHAYSEQNIYERDIERDDPALVQTIEELGVKANGRHAELSVVEIPDDVDWHISEYDGLEHVAERHRTWR